MTSAAMSLLGIDDDERAIVEVVRDFVDKSVRPVVHDLEKSNTYPEALIEQMKALGVFGLAIPEPYGDGKVSTSCYALVAEELARGWMSLTGAMGGHTVVAKLIGEFGTEAQKSRYLPRMATGELRATMALTEPRGGSDLANLTTSARQQPDGSWVINGAKTWITNARRSGLIALLCRTNPDAQPSHSGISVLLVEKVDGARDGLTVGADMPKLGYKGVESCELFFENCQVDADAVLGDAPGTGFKQMMRGLEVGRINVAARATGVARAALDDAVGYAKDRVAEGKPIWQHQAVGHLIADMGTKLEAAHQLLMHAARVADTGARADMETGMAKLFASEVAMQITTDAIRVHGGMGYSTEFNVERYFRDAPLMIVGEGTNEIQKNIISRQLVARSGR